MRRAHAVIAAAGIAALLSAAPSGADHVGTHKVLLPGDIPFTAGPPSLPAGAEAAILYGDPAKEGMFVMRLKAPKGYRIPPHTHPKAEVVSIVSGRMRLGLGQAADRASVEELPAGAFSIMPPGVAHYAFFDAETVLQIDAMGPWSIDYVNAKDDPRNQIAPAQR
ncbi:cupin [Methylosinus sp. sav-2]|uniref:cupin domain-containing protein n=1 Tax=Methylosinus sp. sav-2 TaxID=2485168 RepID=UPI00047DD862|nr:cupin domain-containing protein [Methylosinus sp. sav-2]TDX65916.1 cupin [Methylosinus sp. sav-2]